MENFDIFDKQMRRQADWLKDLRNQLFRKANLRVREQILDIGCGSGIITNELSKRSKNNVTGVDKSPEKIELLKFKYPDITFICSDALNLPFQDESFDLITTSWLWVWINDINKFAQEIKRLLKPGGAYISLAEIDSEAIIEYPDSLARKKDFYIEFIKSSGGDPFVARKLVALFNEPNLNTKYGASLSMFDFSQLEKDYIDDWQQIMNFNNNFFTENEFKSIKMIEKDSILKKTRFSFRPVFWLFVIKAY
ncbi:MAG: class I SAM-dependent methyltransferase [Cyanobacteriota bacterium]